VGEAETSKDYVAGVLDVIWGIMSFHHDPDSRGAGVVVVFAGILKDGRTLVLVGSLKYMLNSDQTRAAASLAYTTSSSWVKIAEYAGSLFRTPPMPENIGKAVRSLNFSQVPSQRIQFLARRFKSDKDIVLGSPIYVTLSGVELSWERNLRAAYAEVNVGLSVDPVEAIHASRRVAIQLGAARQSEGLRKIVPMMECYGDPDLILWAKHELDGFESNATIPPYRENVGKLVDENGKISNESVSIRVPLETVESREAKFDDDTSVGGGYLFHELSLQTGKASTLWLSRSSLIGISEGVANRVMQFTAYLINRFAA
jgi:hypothetical protein